MTGRAPSLSRIISTDYTAMLAAIAPVVLTALYTLFVTTGLMAKARGWDPLMGDNGRPFFFWFAAASIAAGIPVLFWRLRMVRGVFENGVEVPGVITHIMFFKDRGRVEYSYEYEGQAHRAGQAFHRNRRTAALQLGQRVAVMVDRFNPSRALIRDLYLD